MRAVPGKYPCRETTNIIIIVTLIVKVMLHVLRPRPVMLKVVAFIPGLAALSVVQMIVVLTQSC